MYVYALPFYNMNFSYSIFIVTYFNILNLEMLND